MDGLLIDSERYMWRESVTIAAKEQGKYMSEELHRSFMGASEEKVSTILKNEFGQDFDCKLLFERSRQLNKDIMKQGIPLMKGTRQLLDYLHNKGIKTCIGTSTPRIGTMSLLKADNLLDDFDDIVCGDEIKKGKPAPDIYIKCFEKFNVSKQEALIFEDGDAGARAALATGIRLVLVPDLAYLSEEVKEKAFKVIEDLSKIIEVIEQENEGTTSI